MYTFTPMSDEQINSFSLLEEGIYDFEVIKSNRKVSKAGNPMAEININVWDKSGKSHLIFDYLVFSSVPLNIKKVKHFCETTGLHEEYQRGEIPEGLEHLSGKLQIGIQEEQPNGNGGFYPRKNVVVDYIKSDKVAAKDSPQIEDDNLADIPF